MPTPASKLRSIVYVDGFNLYYGAVRDTQYKWLDIQAYFSRLLPHDDLQQIYYFSAEVWGDAGHRQRIYLQALSTLPLVTIVLGHFKKKRIRCKHPKCKYPGDRRFQTYEEKHTDVNIAVQMLADAHSNQCDRFIVVTGDSDLVPPIRYIQSMFKKKQILVYVPATNDKRGAAVELRTIADRAKTLPNNLLPKSQFPRRISDGSGGWIEKPKGW